MSEEIKDIMDALENNELKNDGFWGRACSRLSQQLQTAKEENEKLTQQNKEMREALEFIKTKYEPYIAYLQVVEDINKIMTALKGGSRCD